MYSVPVPVGELFINVPIYDKGRLHLERCERITVNNHSWSGSGIKTDIHHLYVAVDNSNSVSIDDYVIDNYNHIYQVVSFNNGIPVDENGNGSLFIKKIVASSDRMLGLPLIEEDFIIKYVDSYNKNEPINVVNVRTRFDDEFNSVIRIEDNKISIDERFILHSIETADWESHCIIDTMSDKVILHFNAENGGEYCKSIGEKIIKALNS